MAVQRRNEVEIKYHLGKDLTSFDKYRQLVEDNGFRLIDKRFETDYLPDTVDDLCKTSKILFRIRETKNASSNNLLLTIKTRRNTENALDFYEIETNLNSIDQDTFDYISNRLDNITGIKLSPMLLQVQDLDSAIEILQNDGYKKTRILLDKYREEYKSGREKVMLDYFPSRMGAYMEIESHSLKHLNGVIDRLKLSDREKVTLDYGDLLKEFRKDSPPEKQRTLRFTKNQMKTLFRIIQNV